MKIKNNLSEANSTQMVSSKSRWAHAKLRNILLGRLSKIQYGRLTIKEGSDSWEIGDKKSGGISAVIEITDPGFYADVIFGGSIGAAESYVLKKWDTPDLSEVVRLLAVNRDVLTGMDDNLLSIQKPLRSLLYKLQRNTIKGSKSNIAAHYDLPDKLFELFLDETRLYSCAYFFEGAETLKDAQVAKMELIGKKLNLNPSHHVLEIGTGWGALAVFLAKRFGCKVTTTTISENQFAYTQNLIRERGLEDRITLLKMDYRKLEGQYDRVVSIEMIEAVGAEFLPVYIKAISDRLKVDGRALIQAITLPDQEYDRAVKEVDFIKKHIFPGSFIPSLHAILEAAKTETDLRLNNTSDMAADYARTLKEWKTRFNRNKEEIMALGMDEGFIRLWNFYFSYCIGGFMERAIGVSQLVFDKPMYR